MIFPKAEIKGIQKVLKSVDQAEKANQKAMRTAIRVEGFRLRNLMKKEIKQGRPGGLQWSPLSYIAASNPGIDARFKSGPAALRKRNRNRPLAALHYGVHYDVTRDNQNPFMAYVGFGEPYQAGSWAKKQSGSNLAYSKSWRRLARIHQEGFSADIDKGDRRWFAYKGGKLSKRTATRKFYFIRKDRHSFKTPARPIIQPFLLAYRNEALRNIGINFRRKLKGDRI
jgi:hypothetical protein